jgi:hypothetical protein
MGGFGSKPAAPTPTISAPTLDLSKFTTTGDYAAQLQSQAASAIRTAQSQITTQTGLATKLKWIGRSLGVVLVAVFLAFLIDFIALRITGKELSGFGWLAPSGSSGGGGQVPASNILYIGYGRYGTDQNDSSQYVDVTDKLQAMIVGETTLPSFVVGWSGLGMNADPFPGKLKTLYVEFYVGTGGYTYTQADDGAPFPQLPGNFSSPGPTSPSSPVAAPPPSVGSRIYNAIFGDSSGDLAPSFHDASTSAIIQGNRAPLSSKDQGGYGMQWWMYVKDWNYGYGKKKSVVKRPDSTNSSVLNPHISLHPTDNSLQISVSVFPTTEGGASKSTPAPAGHSGSTDDVFVCEVPNIPLQTWFSVSVTVFGRNLDVYIDGKLVKSCFLSGVPKPAVGDIQLTPEGGFSGRICNFYHYPRMLTPSDALSFWQAGTTCKNKTAAGGSSAATGYSVKFGVYDSLGKEVQEYAF